MCLLLAHVIIQLFFSIYRLSFLHVSAIAVTLEVFAPISNLSRALGTSASAKTSDDGAAGPLSDKDEKLASKYRKMLKMGIPPDAVRHKMTSDGLPPKIVSAVLGGGDNSKEQPKEKGGSGGTVELSDEDEAVANKFRKMMKMKIPAEAVRHKMTMEGVNSKIIAAVFEEPNAAGATAQEQQLSSGEEVIASRYRKMLKMGVPFSGVEHKMKQDGIDLKIVSALVEETSPSSADAGSAPKPPGPKKSSSKSATDDERRDPEARDGAAAAPSGRERRRDRGAVGGFTLKS